MGISKRQPGVKVSTPFSQQAVAGVRKFREALESGKPIEKKFTVRSVELNLGPATCKPDDTTDNITRYRHGG